MTRPGNNIWRSCTESEVKHDVFSMRKLVNSSKYLKDTKPRSHTASVSHAVCQNIKENIIHPREHMRTHCMIIKLQGVDQSQQPSANLICGIGECTANERIFCNAVQFTNTISVVAYQCIQYLGQPQTHTEGVGRVAHLWRRTFLLAVSFLIGQETL